LATVGFTQAGSNILKLNGSSSYTGATNVNSGTLIVSGSLTGTTNVNIASGATLEVDGFINTSATTTLNGTNATLEGSGKTDPITANGGTIEAGYTLANGATTTGTMQVNGPITLSGSTNFAISLGLVTGSSADTDQLLVNSGTVYLNNANLVLTIGAAINKPANVGTLYEIINGGYVAGTSGQFADNTIDLPGGFDFSIFYGENSSGNAGPDVVVELTAIPEPDTWAAISCGLTMLLFVQWIRRKSHP
jgi:autotransporter-associated beta strand protein